MDLPVANFTRHTPLPPCPVCGRSSATGDKLTGLADRDSFHTALARVGEADSAGLLLIDLDRFKAVNDTMGHAAGDALLAAAARRLRHVLREGDVAARLNGDEFAVLLMPPVSRDDVACIAGRLVELLSKPFLTEAGIATVGASIGAVMADGAQASPANLLEQADLAMSQAKAGGRGRIAFFTPSLREQADQRRSLELDLRAALSLRQFELFYQPQVSLEDGALTGFEALIRWRHPGRGLVPPDQFIPLAEELGLINGIGEWVILTACDEAARWRGAVSVAVNVAARQFDDHRLVPVVEAGLLASGLDPARLELEITESALLRSTASVVAQLTAVKALGVQVSLDDFGTGYSSLTQLRSFAFDRVKIDRSFVDDEAVVCAVAAMGRSLGMRTTAEGIETPQQVARHRAGGCTHMQGYYLSRPVPATEVGGLIARLGPSQQSAATLERAA